MESGGGVIDLDRLDRLRKALATGASDRLAAKMAGIHWRSAMYWRRAFESEGLLAQQVMRTGIDGRYFDFRRMGAHKRISLPDGSEGRAGGARRRLQAIAGALSREGALAQR